MDDRADDALLLPPLPRPLVPTHARSFSSSSSSSSSAASEADEAETGSPFSFPAEWTSSTTAAQVETGSAAGPRRFANGPSEQEGRVGRAVANASALDGTSPPLGMLADEQPFAESFADQHPSWAGAQQPSGPAAAASDVRAGTRFGNRSAISAADLDFPRSAASPSPAPSRSSGTDTVDGLPSPTPTTAHSASHYHQTFVSRVSPNLSAAAQSRFASTSVVGLRASPSPSTHSRRSPSLPSSPPLFPTDSNDHHDLERRHLPIRQRSQPLRETESPGQSRLGGLATSASVASDLGGTVRRRAPFAGTAGAAEEDRLIDGLRGGLGAEANAVATPAQDEQLLRRRKYRARGPYTAAASVSGGSADRDSSVVEGANPGAQGRETLNEINKRGGDVASSTSVQDPALRRTATAETLRGSRDSSVIASSVVDEFGIVSHVGDRDRAVPRSRTMGDLQGEAGRRSSATDTGRDLSRSASTASRTYGYRSGSRASQVLASVRSHSTLLQYDSPTRAPLSTRSRVRSNELDSPPPLPGSTSTFQLRYGERERASTALGSAEDRDRRGFATGGSGDWVGSRRQTPLAMRTIPSGMRRYDADQTQSPTATRASTSLGTAASARHRRALELGAHSSEDEDAVKLDRRASVARSRTSFGVTPNRVQRGSRASTAGGSPVRQADTRGAAEGARALDDALEAELERTPRSGKKDPFDSTFTPTNPRDKARRALYSDSYDVRAAPPAAGTGPREGGPHSVRRRRSVTDSQIGSDAALAEVDRTRNRENRSRLSRRSSSGGDAASVVTTRMRADVDRERTVRAINDVLRDQGIVAAVASDSFGLASPASSNSSPRKRESFAGFDHSRSDVPSTASSHRLVFGRDLPAGLPSSRSLQSDLSRRSSMLSVGPGRAETALRGLIDRAGPDVAEHHHLLVAAFERFDMHFTEAAEREGASPLPSSPSVGLSPAVDLIKRMDGLVNSTTRLNSGLRGLLEAVKADQVEAQLADEGERNRSSLSHFERSVNALLRTSEDQIRSLTEDLVAIIRLDRDRTQSATISGIADNRPTSRASTYRSSLTGSAGRAGDSMQSPPRRATTASPYQGSTVSHASVRSPTAIRQMLRDPLLEQTPSPNSSAQSAHQRPTMGYAAGGPSPRSPLAQIGGTPSSAGRRESTHARSPLAEGATAYDTPSRAASLRRQSAVNGVTGSASYSGRNGLTGLGLPLPPADVDGQQRRNRTSDATVRPPSPTQTRVARATYPVTSVDSTQATTQSSPTHPSAGFEAPSTAHNRDLPAIPQTSPVTGMQRFPSTPEGLHPTISASSAVTIPNESPASSRKRSLRISGGLGAVIKNAFTNSGNRKPAGEGVTSSPAKTATPPPVPPLPTSGSGIPLERTSSVTSSASIQVHQDRVERRREMEGNLRRA